MKKRTVAVLCAAAAILGVIIGGTMAYLQHSAAIVNTFTAGKIGITLTETARKYVMAPGTALDKDPTVTVDKDSESCYLFVKVKEDNFDAVEGKRPISWTYADGWTEITNGVEGLASGERLFYQAFIKGAEDLALNKDQTGYDFPFLAYQAASGEKVANKVWVNENLTKNNMTAYENSKPQLIFTAYAIQKDWLTKENGTEITDPAEIWGLVKDAQNA